MSAAAGDSQEARILAALRAGIRITAGYALQEFHCFRLAARIDALRRHHGIQIESRLIKTPSGKHIAEYFLP